MNILIFLFSIVFSSPNIAKVISVENCACQYDIYYRDLYKTFPAPCQIPATIEWIDAGFKNTLIITDCMGSGSYTSIDLGNNTLANSANYTNAESLSVDSIYTYNEDTFNETLEVITQYRPLKNQ